jgi:hypothetical protein
MENETPQAQSTVWCKLCMLLELGDLKNQP